MIIVPIKTEYSQSGEVANAHSLHTNHTFTNLSADFHWIVLRIFTCPLIFGNFPLLLKVMHEGTKIYGGHSDLHRFSTSLVNLCFGNKFALKPN